MEIKYGNKIIEIDETDNSVSIGGTILPEWVVDSTFDDNQEGTILGVHNIKTNEFIFTDGTTKKVTDEDNIKI